MPLTAWWCVISEDFRCVRVCVWCVWCVVCVVCVVCA
jgi:hypothetical protein